MTKEQLLKDLCGRLPYGVKCIVKSNGHIGVISSIESQYGIATFDNGRKEEICDIKPCLYPLSSMTEEQKEEYNQSRLKDLRMLNSVLTERINDGNNFDRLVVAYNEIDWLNKNHFDYRGLIEKSLALDATGLNVYKEEVK